MSGLQSRETEAKERVLQAAVCIFPPIFGPWRQWFQLPKQAEDGDVGFLSVEIIYSGGGRVKADNDSSNILFQLLRHTAGALQKSRIMVIVFLSAAAFSSCFLFEVFSLLRFFCLFPEIYHQRLCLFFLKSIFLPSNPASCINKSFSCSLLLILE